MDRYQVILWWELRRIPYNVIIGATGVVTVVVMVWVSIIAESKIGVPIGMPSIVGVLVILAYVLAANVCYTGGWLLELLLSELWGLRSPRFAEMVFRLGVVGSILLTLLPAIVIVVSAMGMLEGWIPVPQPGG